MRSLRLWLCRMLLPRGLSIYNTDLEAAFHRGIAEVEGLEPFVDGALVRCPYTVSDEMAKAWRDGFAVGAVRRREREGRYA